MTSNLTTFIEMDLYHFFPNLPTSQNMSIRILTIPPISNTFDFYSIFSVCVAQNILIQLHPTKDGNLQFFYLEFIVAKSFLVVWIFYLWCFFAHSHINLSTFIWLKPELIWVILIATKTQNNQKYCAHLNQRLNFLLYNFR